MFKTINNLFVVLLAVLAWLCVYLSGLAGLVTGGLQAYVSISAGATVLTAVLTFFGWFVGTMLSVFCIGILLGVLAKILSE